MDSNTMRRKDCTVDADGRTRTIWAWRLPDASGDLRDGLLVLFNLIPTPDCTPVLHAPDVTHEFQVYEVDPATPIDFGRNLFEQKSVSPLIPATVAYQFRAQTELDAIERLSDLTARVADLSLAPDSDTGWALFLSDGVNIRSSLTGLEESEAA